MKSPTALFEALRAQVFGRRGASLARGGSALFVPGAFFLALGLATLLAPRLFLALIAAFFFFVGAMFCVLAWKFVKLKHKVEQVARNFEGRIVVHGMPERQPDGQEPGEWPSERERRPERQVLEYKKFILH